MRGTTSVKVYPNTDQRMDESGDRVGRGASDGWCGVDVDDKIRLTRSVDDKETWIQYNT